MRISRNRLRLATAALIGGLVLAACGDSAPSAEPASADGGSTSSKAVEVVNIAYAPEALEVALGTEVTWTNEDEGVRHTVTSGTPGDNGVPGVSEGQPSRPDGIFDGDLPDASSRFAFTFDEAGTFPYFCEVHPSMTGEIVVR